MGAQQLCTDTFFLPEQSSNIWCMSRLAPMLKDMWMLSFLRDVLCEFLGTTFFIFASLASIALWPNDRAIADEAPGPAPLLPTPISRHDLPHDSLSGPLHVSLASGMSLTIMLVCFGSAVPGGVHLNPAVTLAHAAGLRISPWKAILYVGVQLLGAVSACGALLMLGPAPLCHQGALNQVAPGICPYQAFTVEMVVTFFLVLCVFVTSQAKSHFQNLAPLMVGLSVTLGHLIAIGFTGCGMNPARSFGPAVVTLNFHNHWVYWAGPCTGALLAGTLHDLLLYPRWSRPADWLDDLKQMLLNGHRKQPGSLGNTGE